MTLDSISAWHKPTSTWRLRTASFRWNFVKAYISIWLQMVIVVCLGVMFSTFLSSPVAILATVSAVLLGFFSQFVRDLWTGEGLWWWSARGTDSAGQSGQLDQAAGFWCRRYWRAASSSSSTCAADRS